MVLGSGIRDSEKTYSGSRIQGSKSTQSRIRIRITGWGSDTVLIKLVLGFLSVCRKQKWAQK